MASDRNATKRAWRVKRRAQGLSIEGDPVKAKERQKKYRKSAKGKASRRKANKAWFKTLPGKKYKARSRVNRKIRLATQPLPPVTDAEVEDFIRRKCG